MPLGFLGNIFGSAISAGASYANTKQTNEANLQMTRETNAANREMVEMQNKAAAAESEKAYRRSMPANQVGNMMSAGMSRAGAINALSGGGSYTPAPVNVAQDSAPQMQSADLSSLANIGQGLAEISQRKHEEKMQAKQLAASEKQHKAQLESNERIAQLQADTTNRNADKTLQQNYLIHQQELQYKNDDLNFRKQQYEYGKKLVDSQVAINVATKNKIVAELNDFSSKPAKDAREAKYQVEKLASLYNYRVNENDFYKYLRDNYIKGEDGNYYPIASQNLGSLDQGVIGQLESASDTASAFWSLLFSIIPVKPLLECLKLFGS